MGNSLCDYRARIGLFYVCGCRQVSSGTLIPSVRVILLGILLSNYYIVIWVILLQLILSGDIELNPGPTEHDQLTFSHVNIRSLTSGQKLDDLSYRIDENKSALIGVTETWLDKTVDDKSIAIPGFEVVRKDRNREGGGVAVYIRNDLSYRRS